MAMRDDEVHRLDDMMRGGVERRHHMGELVEDAEVRDRGAAPDIFEVAQIRSARHRDEDGLFAAKLDVLGWISRVIGDVRRDRADQFHDQATIQMDAFASNIGANPPPVVQGNGITKDDADFLQDRQ